MSDSQRAALMMFKPPSPMFWDLGFFGLMQRTGPTESKWQ